MLVFVREMFLLILTVCPSSFSPLASPPTIYGDCVCPPTADHPVVIPNHFQPLISYDRSD